MDDFTIRRGLFSVVNSLFTAVNSSFPWNRGLPEV